MQLSDLDYDLPADLIAQEPLEDRSSSRMLLVDRSKKTYEDSSFINFPDQLIAGDVLVLNNTKVFPARLLGRTETGANVEIFLVKELEHGSWESLVRPARRLRRGKKVYFGDVLAAVVVELSEGGRATVVFDSAPDFDEKLLLVGRTPLPPYIKREREAEDRDRTRYQTIFASERGAIAAPTAGLHFTPEVMASIRAKEVQICEITLHVGYGTFEPVRTDEVALHSVQAEDYGISEQSAEMLNAAIRDKRRIIAVGTTSTRTLENAISVHGKFVAERSAAELTIKPGYQFKAIDGLLTNFHLPKSSLLILVSTFAGHELIMKAYRHAVSRRYRFYSYGDCMLIT
jgi:S-adenosylmethionine:tRNA ribosyltransferase-isomerase